VEEGLFAAFYDNREHHNLGGWDYWDEECHNPGGTIEGVP
jgi:hypothetical protein